MTASSASPEFDRLLLEAIAIAGRIHDRLADGEWPEGLRWGDVGDMAEAVRALRAVADRLFAEGRHATSRGARHRRLPQRTMGRRPTMTTKTTTTELRRCTGSARFGIEPHEAPVSDFPKQPSPARTAWARCAPSTGGPTSRALREARKAAQADEARPPADRRPTPHSAVLPPLPTGPGRTSGAFSRYARHGQQLGGESPLGNEVVRTPSRRQRRHREVGSEGSPRQSPDPRDTNRIRGWIARMSRPSTVMSATTKGLSGKCGGAGTKAAVLIRGDLPGCRGDPTGSAARCWWTRQESAEAVVPAGMDHAGKGRTSDRGTAWTDSWMGHRPQPPCPRGRPASGGGR